MSFYVLMQVNRPYGISLRTEMLQFFFPHIEAKMKIQLREDHHREGKIRIKENKTKTTTMREIISTKPHTKER